MTSLHNSFQLMGNCRGTALLQLFNIVNEKYTGISGINNVETSPVASHFSTLPINSKSLLMKNVVAPNLGGSLSQRFSRLTQQVVFDFLRGHWEVEELPCFELSGDRRLYKLRQKVSTVEKNDQESTQVKDVVPSQSSVFDFLNGDICQLLIFVVDFDLGSEKVDRSDLYDISIHLSLLDLNSSSDEFDDMRHSIQENESSSTTSNELQLTGHYAKVHDDVEWMFTDAVVKDDGCSGEMDENILYSPFHHWHKMFKDDPLSDFVISAKGHQYHGSENCHGIMSKLNCNAEIFEQSFKFALEKHGFVTGNYHEETVTRISMLLPSSESIVPPVDEEHNENSDSTFPYHQSFDSFSDAHMRLFPGNHDNTTFGDMDSLNDCETSGQSSSEVFGTLEQHPAIGNTEELKFSIPDPDELMKYLYGSISSPKFFASDLSNGESDNFHLSSHFGNRNSDEVAKSDNLSDSTTNGGGVGALNDSEYGTFDIFGITTESEIGATTGAFGEIETPDISSLPDTSDIKRIRWNWCSRDVDSSLFNLSEHHDLLELYGLKEQDVNAFDDNFCESPTWPEEKHIQGSELCFIKSTSTSTHHHSFDPVSDPQNEWTMEINKETISHCGNTDSSIDFGTSGHPSSEVFGELGQHPNIGTTDKLKFSIPDPDELMKYLLDTISSPKFLASDQSNGEPDNSHFSSHSGNRNSNEVAKSDNLLDSTTNAYFAAGVNDNKYGIFDTFGYATEPGIGAITGAFGEIETSSIPSLLDTSKIEKIRWSWYKREVDSSAFDFDDHQDLLELYGLSEQDVQANDDEFIDSPTWPGKP
ncbi:unnamed protein product [Caenorhabditis brenneri]